MSKFLSATLAFGLLGTSLSAPLYAQERLGQTAVTVEVDFSDLSVTDDYELELIRSRINKAVRRACPKRIEGPVKNFPDPNGCRKAAWLEAERQLVEVIAKAKARARTPERLAFTTGPATRSHN